MVKTGEIASDATLADIRDRLAKPEDHVATVLLTMQPCRKAHGNAYVRIGITGTGKAPYHKVVYLDTDGAEQLFGSLYGRNMDADYQVHENTWSTKMMSFAEVQTLLGEIRGIKPNGVTN